jgi:hypothetical protein
LSFEVAESRQTISLVAFSATVLNSVRFASTSPGKSLEHVSSKNAGTGKPGALLHQVDDRGFSLTADDGQAAQVDY